MTAVASRSSLGLTCLLSEVWALGLGLLRARKGSTQGRGGDYFSLGTLNSEISDDVEICIVSRCFDARRGVQKLEN